MRGLKKVIKDYKRLNKDWMKIIIEAIDYVKFIL